MSRLGNSAMPECCLPGEEAIGARLINGSGLRRLLLNGIVPSSYNNRQAECPLTCELRFGSDAIVF